MLTYFDDEVKKYHPVVEKCLNQALRNIGLDGEYEIMHHLDDGTRHVPDFVLRRKDTQFWVSVIEVKKTPTDAISRRYGEQAMGYVANTKDKDWGKDYPWHFCVTNIERTQFYCYRDKKTSPLGCVLKNSPHLAGKFDTNYAKTLSNFTQRFEKYFQDIHSKTEPEIGSHFQEISVELDTAYESLKDTLNWGTGKLEFATSIERENIIYELLRISFYYYIQGKYMTNKSPKHKKFTDLKTDPNSKQLVDDINAAFKTAMEIDFTDILSNNESEERMFPEQVIKDSTIADIFTRFLKVMNNNTKQGMSYQSELIDFVGMITGTLYDQEEMRKYGKVMSGEVLANVLAGFAINTANASVLDPSCGDGELLIASYNRIQELKKKSSCSLLKYIDNEHNRILNQLYGIELDRNLVQLSRFKLICTDLSAVNKKTRTNISIGDSILDDFNNQFDAVVMNPPFIRNDKPAEQQKNLTIQYKAHLAETNGEQSLWSETAKYNIPQPNYYHYHIEKCLSYLKEDGIAATIVMEKMLHNKSGTGLKNLLLNHLEAVISYPAKYFFEDRKVTTCILILKKNPTTENIGFLNIKNTSILADVEHLKLILSAQKEIDNSDMNIQFKNRKGLNPEDDWRTYLLSKKTNIPYALKSIQENLIPINDVFEIKRGGSGNTGDSKIIYLQSDDKRHKSIEASFRGPGMNRNEKKYERKIVLTTDDVGRDEAFWPPSKYLDAEKNGFRGLSKYPGLEKYWMHNLTTFGIKKWKKWVDAAYKHNYSPDILIPRADRTKHLIHLNSSNLKFVLSTNFFALSDFKLPTSKHSKDKQIKFCAAFLLSSFGQLLFEMSAGDQEGMRKIEKYQILSVLIPDSNMIELKTLEKVNSAFDAISNKPSNFIGREGLDGPRRQLDLAVAEYLYSKDNLGFEDIEKYTDFFENTLEEIVEKR